MLVPKQQEIDLGTIKFGKPKEFEFVLTNKATTTMSINRITVGCQACTTATITNPDVGPNSTTKVYVTYTPNSTGISSKSLSIIYNNNMNLKLKFKAVVEK